MNQIILKRRNPPIIPAVGPAAALAPALWDHPNPVTISHSSMGTWESCKRKFEINKFYRLPKRREIATEADAGHALHAGFQQWLATGDRDAAIWAMMKKYNIGDNATSDAVRSLEACYATLICMMQSVNLVEYQVATIKCIDGKERMAIEVEFELWLEGVTIFDRPVVYRGFLDAILFNLLTAEYVCGDVKTHRDDPATVDRNSLYQWSGQGIPYSLVIQWIAQHAVEAFTMLYVDAYIDILEPKVRVFSYEKTRSDVEDWFTNLYFNVKAMKEMAERNFFPRTEHGCRGYFKRPCRFLNVCQERNRSTLQGLLLMDGEDEELPKKRAPWVRLIMPMQV